MPTNKKTYKLAKPPSNYPGRVHKNGHVQEHRLVWWENTGDVVPDGYHIHHIDGDTRNNKFSNLAILTSSDHSKLHGKVRATIWEEATCQQCGAVHLKTKIRMEKIGRDPSRIFCSKKCSGKSKRGPNYREKMSRKEFLDKWKFKVSIEEFMEVWDSSKSFRQIERELGLNCCGTVARKMAIRLNLYNAV